MNDIVPLTTTQLPLLPRPYEVTVYMSVKVSNIVATSPDEARASVLQTYRVGGRTDDLLRGVVNSVGAAMTTSNGHRTKTRHPLQVFRVGPKDLTSVN